MGEERGLAEGFPHQRLVLLPTEALVRCQEIPVVDQLYPTHLGSYPSAPRHYVKRVGVEQVIMICCLKGRGSLEMDDRIFKIKKGNVGFVPSGTPHIYRSSRKDPWSICWIHFDGTQKNAVLRNLGVGMGKPLLFVPDTSIVRDAFEEVYACLNYNYSDAGLFAMATEFMRMIGKIRLHNSASEAEKQRVESRILKTVEFMERHTDLRLTLEGLASMAGLSVPHYSKLFRERTEKSPMAYFAQLKMRKACELLQGTDEPVQHVANRLGIEDPFYFSRQFKKIQGVSPVKYRENLSL
ncbi:MAG: AraC family transcriptional regulator [Verrucomicrobiota bacterium]